MIKTGYIFAVLGQDRKRVGDANMAWGVAYGANETEARGWAVQYFESIHPTSSIVSTNLTIANVGTDCFVDNGLLVIEVKE